MTQLGEGVEPPALPAQDQPPRKKKPIKLRCSFFFDGTCNNRLNTDARTGKENADKYEANKLQKAADEQKDKKKLSGKGDDSYENDYTNIATLEPVVWPTGVVGNNFFFKVYTEGPGTVDLARDVTRGYAFGSGEESGVKSKVEKGIAKAIDNIQNTTEIKPNQHYIEEVVLDVFGFSRGAAAARYAIFRLLDDDKKRPFRKRLESLGFEVKDVKVWFAGLFDTVASYNLGQMLHTDNWILKLKAVKHAEATVHLAAAEEYRKNFPLHNIKSAGRKGQEFFLPGVHSDVGGSYVDNDSDSGKTICEGMFGRVKTDGENLVAEGWYNASDLIPEVLTTDDFGNPAFTKVTVKDRIIRNAYCKIPLKIMVDFAKKNGLVIEDKLIDDADKFLYGFDELKSLDRVIQSYVDKGSANSKPSDWQGPHPNLNPIRYKHLHMSSHYDAPMGALAPRFGWFNTKRTRYQFDG